MSKDPSSETFRDSLATIDDSGNRKWIYPKKPKGFYTRWRTILSIALLSILFTGPFIRIGGQPILQFNVLERKFILFGQIFWPQDFHLFVFGMITFVIFIVLFTVVFGRLFCGWICPQTIFMEGVFRKIEYWLEGDWKQQIQLDKQAWNIRKIRIKATKHILFFAISFLIANTFLAYIIGSESLIDIVTSHPKEHLAGFASILIFSGVFYGVFARFREQVCTTVCPYGRLQGVMLDRNSMVVAYDRVRGEERGKFRKNETRSDVGKGDCIDCGHCVHVCPTAIDIRNGTQLECINCTACIDACDEVMEAVGLPPKLIRYTSEEQITTRKPFKLNFRAKAYSALLVVLASILVGLIVARSDIETTIVRTPGMLYRIESDSTVSNLYTFKIINKTNFDMNLKFKLENPKFSIKLIGSEPVLRAQEVAEGAFFLYAKPDLFERGKVKTTIAIYTQDDDLIETVKISAMGPL